ncbi:hypothetical protein POM88_012673 [Heracleum sosnowskyi]|uniref:Uncharacterized protein n=1 Tax=Heracleum sosnowskyi TaxID=360622 RepID=A0AAD8N2P3_9APIA|nr:hypothetical protein POM88_012673 [Heracleum sosnowskyi]
MCNVLDGSRLMYVYCETIEETQGEEVTLSQYPSPNTTQDVEFEKQQLLDIFNLEGIPEDMYDIDHLLCKPICDEQTSEVSDHDNVSFHEDNSNIDSTDEDVRSHKAKMVDVLLETLNWNTEVVDSDFSDCIDSDDERMVANSTDEEDDEKSCFRPDPVCGIDGVTYWCGCADARCAGTRVSKLGACEGNDSSVSGQALLLINILWLTLLAFFALFGLL